jgi:cytidine deaminase
MKTYKYKDLDKNQKKLLKSAFDVMKNSYSPFSNFLVGSAVLSKANDVFTGTNIENSSYGLTICAERSALATANSNGVREITKIAVIGKNGSSNIDEPLAPCGACRQMISEAAMISKKDIEVIMSNTKMDKIIISKISDLLPLSFHL